MAHTRRTVEKETCGVRTPVVHHGQHAAEQLFPGACSGAPVIHKTGYSAHRIASPLFVSGFTCKKAPAYSYLPEIRIKNNPAENEKVIGSEYSRPITLFLFCWVFNRNTGSYCLAALKDALDRKAVTLLNNQ
jgi:hypothetical protein